MGDSPVITILVLLLGVTFALGGALLVGLGQPEFVLFAAACLAAMLVMSSPLAVLYFILIAGLVVTGVTQLYVPGARMIRWLVPAAAGVLLLFGIIQRMQTTERSAPISGISAGLALLLVVSLVSLAINFDSLRAAFNAMQGYFQVSALFIALILVQWRRDTLTDRLPPLLLAIAILQLPFALHQLIAIVPTRQGLGNGVVAVDIISGTFGGSRTGGGANALLALYQVIVVTGLLAYSKERRLRGWQLVLGGGALLAPMLFNAAKVVVLYLPIAFLLVYWQDARKQPLRFLGGGLLTTGMVWLLLNSIATTGPLERRVEGPGDLLSYVIERQTASTSERDSDYAGLSRWTALTFWVEEHKDQNPAYAFLGHGPGATRVQRAGLIDTESLAETRYGGLEIGVTAVAALLWEVGLVGLLVVLGVLYTAFRQASTLARYYRTRDRRRSAIFSALSAAFVLLIVSLFHKDFLVYHLPFQTLFALLLGYQVVEWRMYRLAQRAQQRAETPAGSAAPDSSPPGPAQPAPAL
ncbi:MAG: hypothetical protein AAGI15_05775 [Pseudomonadota bacterium]